MINSKGSHWNRSGRRSGGARKAVIPVLHSTLDQRIEMVIDAELQAGPLASLSSCASKAVKVTGASVEQVAKVIEAHFMEKGA